MKNRHLGTNPAAVFRIAFAEEGNDAQLIYEYRRTLHFLGLPDKSAGLGPTSNANQPMAFRL